MAWHKRSGTRLSRSCFKATARRRIGAEGLFKELKKRLLERALGAELSAHLG